MKISSVRLIAAAFAFMFVAAACASDSGAEWTFAPVAVAEPSTSSNGEVDSETDVEATAPPAEATEPPAEATESPANGGDAVAGEPRVILVQADGALRFTNASGEQLREIPVTPGETVLFEIDNTAGFAHNFYIGQDAELSAPAATTDVGIPDWSTGIQQLEWTVPEDIEGLKFGCTVPGHYTLMQGIFTVSDAPVEPSEPSEPTEPAEPSEPAASMAPEATMAATESAAPGSAGSADARVIDLEATAALQFTQGGEQIRDIPVTPGETIVIRVDNTSGFSHNLYIGTDEQLVGPGATTDIGIPDWDAGVQFVEWEVPADITGLKFGCTVPGHYTLMQGTFSVSP